MNQSEIVFKNAQEPKKFFEKEVVTSIQVDVVENKSIPLQVAASGQLTAKANHVLVSGIEMYGNIELPTAANVTLEDLKAFPSYMEAKGLEVLEFSIEENEVLRVFWKYVGK